MDLYSEQACDGIELLDLLFDKNDGILRHEDMMHHNEQPWPVQNPNMMMPAQGGEEFFNALMNGTDSGSVSGSPLWSPSPSDSGISEDPHSDHNDSPPPPGSPPLEACYLTPQPRHILPPDTRLPVDFNGWGSGIFPERPAGMPPASEVAQARPTTAFPLTVKDLLLSGTPEPVSTHSFKIKINVISFTFCINSQKNKITFYINLKKMSTNVLEPFCQKIANFTVCVTIFFLQYVFILINILLMYLHNISNFSRSLHNLQSSRVLHALERPFSVVEESEPLPGFPGDKGMEEISSLMEKLHMGPGLSNYDLGADNTSLEQPDDHHHGDPITGHIATVTLSRPRGAPLRPHADDI
uniref:Uncharacterized protein n=1 Tax=Astyanax mexicanus TaxID=7994 RepID=A0A8B9K7X6_ASTMX